MVAKNSLFFFKPNLPSNSFFMQTTGCWARGTLPGNSWQGGPSRSHGVGEEGGCRQRAIPGLFSSSIPKPSPTETSCYDPHWSWLVRANVHARVLGRGGVGGEGWLSFRLQAIIERLGPYEKSSLGDPDSD